jgi:hypothetical protein
VSVGWWKPERVISKTASLQCMEVRERERERESAYV